jgi:xanthine dehydrogenase accessory factor
MLVLEDGRIIGTIGGGCMESEVQHLCLRMLHEERAQGQIFTVDMTASQAEEEGLVCGGTIQVFMEVI